MRRRKWTSLPFSSLGNWPADLQYEYSTYMTLIQKKSRLARQVCVSSPDILRLVSSAVARQ